MTTESTKPNETAGPDIVEPSTAVVVTTDVEAFKDLTEGMTEMMKLKDVIFDLATVKGDKQARQDRQRLVRTRTTIEARRAELNRRDRESIAASIAARDTEAARLTALVKSIEEPLDAQIAADEERRERVRQAERAAEESRVQGLRDRIADITSVATRAVSLTAAEIQKKIELVTRMEIGEDFQELQGNAVNAKASTLLSLQDLKTAAEKREADAAAAQREKEELARLRLENEERQAREAQERRERDESEARARQHREADEKRERETRETAQRQQDAANAVIGVLERIKRRSFSATAAGMLALVTEAEAVEIGPDLGPMVASAQASKDEVLAQLHEMHTTAITRETEQRERQAEQDRMAEENRVARAAQQRTANAIEQIKGIQQQPMIAILGRGSRVGGTIECIRETLAETEAWLITEEEFGMLSTPALIAKNNAIADIREALANAEAKAAESIAAPPAGPAGDGSQTPDDGAEDPAAKAGQDAHADKAEVPSSPGTPGAYASTGAEAAQIPGSGDEDKGAHAEERAPDSAGLPRQRVEGIEPFDVSLVPPGAGGEPIRDTTHGELTDAADALPGGPGDDYRQIPVLINFDRDQMIGMMELKMSAIPTKSPNYVFALGIKTKALADDAELGAPIAKLVLEHELMTVSLMTDLQYVAYLRHEGVLKDQFVDAASFMPHYEALIAAVVDVMKASTLTKGRGKTAGTWSVPDSEMQALKAALRKQPLPGGQFYAEDGTLKTADGKRSVFDDVAE